MKNVLLLVCSFILVMNTTNSAQQQSVEVDSQYVNMSNLDEVSVTAERFPVKEKDVPRFVTIASNLELQQTGANNLVDALKRMGGLTYKSYGPMGISHGGMNSKVSIRGVQGGEMILLNGVNIQSAASRSYDLNLISLEQIERVEVLKGAASTVYGSNAMSGVINIITKKSGDEPRVFVGVEGGNYDYLRGKIGGQYKGLNLSFEYQHLAGIDGISYSQSSHYAYNTGPSKQYNWSMNYKFLDNIYIDYLGTYNESKFDRVYDNPAKKMIGTDQIQNKHFMDVRYENENLRSKVYANFDAMKRDRYTDQSYADSKSQTYNMGADVDYRLNINGYSINPGINTVYRVADYSSKYGRKYDMHYALFLQVKKEYFEKLNLVAGVREQFVNGGSQDKDYDIFLPSFGLTYKINEEINFFGSMSKAFRTPTFNNLYYKGDVVTGNDDLKPEKGYTYETGFKFDSPVINFRISGFYMDYDDKIEIDKSGEVRRYINAGEYKSKGIEWKAELMGFDLVKLPLVFTFSGYYADPTAKIKDNASTQMGPKLQFNAGIKYFSSKLTVELNSVLMAEREYDLDNYFSMNFFAGYKVWKGRVTLAIDNLLDRENVSCGNFSPNSRSRYAYYDLGRQVKVGYQFSL